MDYNNSVLVHYRGDRKIYAIKALRSLAHLGLKEAKDAIESEGGFLLTVGQMMELRTLYLQNVMNGIYHDLTANAEFVTHYRAHYTDFFTQPATIPLDLRGNCESVRNNHNSQSDAPTLGEILGAALRK